MVLFPEVTVFIPDITQLNLHGYQSDHQLMF